MGAIIPSILTTNSNAILFASESFTFQLSSETKSATRSCLLASWHAGIQHCICSPSCCSMACYMLAYSIVFAYLATCSPLHPLSLLVCVVLLNCMLSLNHVLYSRTTPMHHHTPWLPVCTLLNHVSLTMFCNLLLQCGMHACLL